MRLTLFSALLSASSAVLAVTLNGSLVFDQVLPGIAYVPVPSRVLLNYGDKSALIRQDGSFEIAGVEDGHHILTTVVPGYIILPLLLTVEGDNVHVQYHQIAKEPLPTTAASLAYPIKLVARGKEDFFTKAAGMNMLGMLRSPMVILMLISGLMMWGLPKLTAYIESSDPDLAREMSEQRKKMNGYQNMDWTGNLSSMLAGGEEESKSSGGGSGMKKRKGR